jgi:hypothetical protein
MPVPIKSECLPLTREQVMDLEKKLGCTFPPEYRDFLFTTNVGTFSAPARHGRGPGAPGVSVLFGVCGEEDGDLLAQREIYEGRIPAGYLAVGSDGGGNLICLRYSDGTVYFWDHEGEASGVDAPTMTNMHKIAGTFTEFIAGIEEIPHSELELDPKDIKSVWVDPEFLKSLK